LNDRHRYIPGSGRMWSAAQLGVVLAIGGLGGYLFSKTGIPLAWMLGSMVFAAAASIFRPTFPKPGRLRTPMVAIIGVTLGSSFTPQLIASVSEWWITVAGLLSASAISTALGYRIFRKVARFDAATAYFSATPGGLLEMSLMGEERGGNGHFIVLAHTIRIFCVVLILPPALAWYFGFSRATLVPAGGVSILAPLPFTWFLISALAGLWLGKVLRLPARHLTGPMLVSGIIHLLGLTDFRPPPELIALAQVIIGVSLGARFSDLRLGSMPRLVWASIGSVSIYLSVAVCMAYLVAHLANFGFLQILLAYSPGGIAEMSLIAIAMGADAAFVAAHHVIRVVVGLAASPIIYGSILGERSTGD
jgi:uncharacterized protein